MNINIEPVTVPENWTLLNQLEKVREESSEVLEAMVDDDPQHVIYELWDIIQASVTMLDMFEQQGWDIRKQLKLMKRNNKLRGRYAEKIGDSA